MGITWRAMPLLSTLAALVIIVHSAEEELDRGLDRDLDREYRYNLRPRALDVEAPYDQPWRSVEAEPMMQKSTVEGYGIWDDSPERPLKRRKPVRKRKRRPYGEEVHHDEHPVENLRREPVHAETPEDVHLYPEASEDKHVVHRYHETDEPLRYRDTQYNPAPTTEMPKRRRKRPENRRNRWTEDYVDIERPLRRRVQKRKRPSDSSLKLTEFGEFRADEETPRLRDYVLLPEPDEPYDFVDEERIIAEQKHRHHHPKKPRGAMGDPMHLKEDKSLSEFSMEAINPPETTTIRQENTAAEEIDEVDDSKLKGLEKLHSDNSSNLLDKLRGDRPIDPVTLKQILKRSNGSSLSEILQKNNLSLSDLLRGKEEAMSMTKTEEQSNKENDDAPKESNKENDLNTNEKRNAEVFSELKEVISATEVVPEDNEPVRPLETNTNQPSDLESQSTGTNNKKQENNETETLPKISTGRRNSGVRRKLRLRPSTANGIHKSQLNRDLIAQTARKYHNSRNMTKSKEWKYVVPMMNAPNSSEEINNNKNEMVETTIISEPQQHPTTTFMPEEMTTIEFSEFNNPTTIQITTQTDNEGNYIEKETTILISTTQEPTTTEVTTTTEKPKQSRSKPGANRMGLRRQAYNHRLKRKRMKQKNSTTEPSVPRDEFGIDFFGMPNLVSSSEFIARTQPTPKPASTDHIDEDFTTLDDFMTTEKSRHSESGPRFTRNSSHIYEDIEPIKTATTSRFVSTTEETAKFEIEEILNDTRTSARLSRILMERNMTLNELVEHRERGSSHVHLADIFHNASKEPNPPEPFLTKSSIEPISKETYPLRAILEANLHDSAAKATTVDSAAQTYAGNIPVVMDFGNNVNENGENMGIMSLFNKLTEDISSIEESTTGKDSEGTPYVTTVIAVNNTDANETTARESRVLKNEENNLKHDVVGWNELFELMRKNQQNETDSDELDLGRDAPSNHHILLEDSDGDGLIVLEDLQRLKDFSVNTEERLDINSYESDAAVPGILDRSLSHSRSVTVATASIVGLAMILFLLTYAAFKWKQQRNLLRKKQNFPDERIPTPVFENRKSNKINSSTRSISPMLATSNIYTLNTLDSNGKESPDYMWDSLRKPFQ